MVDELSDVEDVADVAVINLIKNAKIYPKYDENGFLSHTDIDMAIDALFRQERRLFPEIFTSTLKQRRKDKQKVEYKCFSCCTRSKWLKKGEGCGALFIATQSSDAGFCVIKEIDLVHDEKFCGSIVDDRARRVKIDHQIASGDFI